MDILASTILTCSLLKFVDILSLVMYTYLTSNVEVFDPEYHFSLAHIDELCVVRSCVCANFNFIVCKVWYTPV